MITIRLKTIAAVGAIGLSMLALVGCSSGGTQAAANSTQQQDSGGSGSDTAQRQRPGVSGTIAAAESDGTQGGKLQVQSSDSQTAVTYTGDTTITRQVAAKQADLVAGVCITGMSGSMPGGDSSGGSSTGSGSESALSRVTISDPVDGACGFGGFGGGGGVPNGGETPEGGTPPTDPPGDGQAPGGAGFGGFASGMVTKVSGSTLTVERTAPDGTTGEQEFTVDDSTSYTRTEQATSKALEVGACVVATGAYSGESLAATSLAVSPAGDRGCDLGFGGRGQGAGQAGGADQAGAGS